MKKLTKIIGVTFAAVSLLLLGGVVLPRHTSLADTSSFNNPCPAGVAYTMNLDGTSSCADGSVVNTTPNTDYSAAPASSAPASTQPTTTPANTAPTSTTPRCTQ